MVNRQTLRGEIEASITELQKSKKNPALSMRKVSLLIIWVMDRLHPQNLFNLRVPKHWNRLHGEVTEPPSLETFFVFPLHLPPKHTKFLRRQKKL